MVFVIRLPFIHMKLEGRNKFRGEQDHISLSIQAIESRLALLSKIRDSFKDSGVVFSVFSHGKDRISEYRKIITELCRDPQTEKQLSEEIDEVTQQETVEFVDVGEASMDVLIVGTGPAGVSMASQIRKEKPEARIIMLDERNYRGGQFADEGFDYHLNSPQKAPKLGFAGELSDRNNLGDSAFMQVSDISDEEYPSRKKLVTTLKINSFLVAPALVDTKIMSIDVTGNKEDPYVVRAFHKNTEREVVLHPKIIVYAGGQGKPKYNIDMTNSDTQEAFQKRGERIYVADTFSKQLEEMSSEEVLKKVKDKVALIGGRDSANVAVEEIIHKLLKILSPEEIQKLRIDVYGTQYDNSEGFEMKIGTNRYNELIPYVGTFIHPHKEKAETLFAGEIGKVGIKTKSSFGTYGHVIMVTGYHNQDFKTLVHGNRSYNTYNIIGQGDMARETVAQQIGHQNIFIVGVAVKEIWQGKIPRFARSIARHTPRVLTAAHHIVTLLDNKQTLLSRIHELSFPLRRNHQRVA